MFLKIITVITRHFFSSQPKNLFQYCESATPEMEHTFAQQTVWKCIHAFTFKFKLQAVNEQCVNAWHLLITEFKSWVWWLIITIYSCLLGNLFIGWLFPVISKVWNKSAGWCTVLTTQQEYNLCRTRHNFLIHFHT